MTTSVPASTSPSLVDIGVNLTDKSFRSDRDAVIDRAQAAGVHRMIVTGTSVDGSRAAVQVAATRPGVLYATCGVHPHHARSFDDTTRDTLTELARAPHVVAIGECGLDYHRDLSPRPVQRRAFRAQLDLAAHLELPVFVHERDAADDTHAILAEYRPSLCAAVVHCFTGDGSALDAYLDLDVHIGITGWICDERRGLHLRELVPRIPEHRLMVETDAPYLLPRTIRPRPKSRRNEPAFLSHVIAAIAEATDRTHAQVARATTATAIRMFGLDAS